MYKNSVFFKVANHFNFVRYEVQVESIPILYLLFCTVCPYDLGRFGVEDVCLLHMGPSFKPCCANNFAGLMAYWLWYYSTSLFIMGHHPDATSVFSVTTRKSYMLHLIVMPAAISLIIYHTRPISPVLYKWTCNVVLDFELN